MNLNKLEDEEAERQEAEISYLELGKALKTMKNDKTPGLDGFTVECFKFLWADIDHFVHRYLNYAYRTGS